VIKADFFSHDPSEIFLICWFAAHETFLIIINVENSFAASYFVIETGTCFSRIFNAFFIPAN